jgi:hypothetical protein
MPLGNMRQQGVRTLDVWCLGADAITIGCSTLVDGGRRCCASDRGAAAV